MKHSNTAILAALCTLLINASCTEFSMNFAIERGNIQKVNYLLSTGYDVNRKALAGQTPLMVAALVGKIEFARLFIDRGAHVNLKDNTGWTALMYAANCLNKEQDVIDLLIEKGADVNAKNAGGTTALMHAARNCHSKKIRSLIDHGADINAKDNDGVTAFIYAARGFLENDGCQVQPEIFNELKSAGTGFPADAALLLYPHKITIRLDPTGQSNEQKGIFEIFPYSRMAVLSPGKYDVSASIYRGKDIGIGLQAEGGCIYFLRYEASELLWKAWIVEWKEGKLRPAADR